MRISQSTNAIQADLKRLEVRYIVRRLDFFIGSHKSDKYQYAREMWKNDKAFISSYMVKPKRFLVLEGKIKRR